MEAYSLEKSIEKFFDGQVSPTRQQCDDLAFSLTQGPVHPIPIQGSYSYTVVSGDDNASQSIIQFRAAESPLDIELLALAKEIYGGFVPSTQYHGDIGSGPTAPAKVYIMEKTTGVTYLESNLQHDDGSLRYPVDRMRVIQEFAR